MKEFSVSIELADEKNADLFVLCKSTANSYRFHLNVEEAYGVGYLFDAINFNAETGHLEISLKQDATFVACPYCGFNMKAIQVRSQRNIVDLFLLSTEKDEEETIGHAISFPYIVVDLAYINNTYHCLSKSCGKFYKYATFLPQTGETQSKVHFSRRFLSFLNDMRAHMVEYMRVERLPQSEYNKQMVADFHFHFGVDLSQPQIYNLLRTFPKEHAYYILEGNFVEDNSKP